jgi:WD40 repeat protein
MIVSKRFLSLLCSISEGFLLMDLRFIFVILFVGVVSHGIHPFLAAIPPYKCKNTFYCGMHYVNSVIPLRDGNVAFALGDGGIKIFSLLSGHYVQEFDGHCGTVRSIIELIDGSIASASMDGFIRIWDRRTGKSAAFKAATGYFSILTQLNDTTIVSTLLGDGINIVNVRSGHVSTRYCESASYVSGIVRLNDKRFVVASRSGAIVDWDFGKGAKNLLGIHIGCIDLIPYPRSNDEIKIDRFISISSDGSVKIWELEDDDILQDCKNVGKFIHKAALLDNGNLALAFDDTTIGIWNMRGDLMIQKLVGHDHPVISMFALADGGFVSISTDGIIKIWKSLALNCASKIEELFLS